MLKNYKNMYKVNLKNVFSLSEMVKSCQIKLEIPDINSQIMQKAGMLTKIKKIIE
jgi:hypothetical protein